ERHSAPEGLASRAAVGECVWSGRVGAVAAVPALGITQLERGVGNGELGALRGAHDDRKAAAVGIAAGEASERPVAVLAYGRSGPARSAGCDVVEELARVDDEMRR